jgi:hypothetical protein
MPQRRWGQLAELNQSQGGIHLHSRRRASRSGPASKVMPQWNPHAGAVDVLSRTSTASCGPSHGVCGFHRGIGIGSWVSRLCSCLSCPCQSAIGRAL